MRDKSKKDKKSGAQKAKKEKGFRNFPHFPGAARKERMKDMNQEENEVLEETMPEAEQEENEQSVEPDEPQAEDIQAELEKAKQERDEYLDLAQRQKAEFANYKRRTEGIRKDAYDESRRDTIEAFLPTLDNLERAMEAAGEEAESALGEGVSMVLRQMRETLTKLGVEEINPVGEYFDANLMNAVLQGTEDEGEAGTVCQVLQKGYKLGDHVIRHAMVKVVAG